MLWSMKLRLAMVWLAGAMAWGQQPDASVAAGSARNSPAWLTSGVIYEVFPREFSAEGNFQGVTKRLDDLRSLGVNMLWLMPIQPAAS